MKSDFLNTPQSYTRASRTGQSSIDMACPVQRFDRKRTGYSALWWAAMVVISIVSVALIVAQG